MPTDNSLPQFRLRQRPVLHKDLAAITREVERQGRERPGVWNAPGAHITDVHSLAYCVVNQAGEEIPAYAAMRVEWSGDTAGAVPVMNAYKPNGSGGNIVINNGYALRAGSRRWLKVPSVQVVALESGDSPSAGDAMGPVSDQWYMSSDGSGWVCCGTSTIDGGAVAAVRPFNAAGLAEFYVPDFEVTDTGTGYGGSNNASSSWYNLQNAAGDPVTVTLGGLRQLAFYYHMAAYVETDDRLDTGAGSPSSLYMQLEFSGDGGASYSYAITGEARVVGDDYDGSPARIDGYFAGTRPFSAGGGGSVVEATAMRLRVTCSSVYGNYTLYGTTKAGSTARNRIVVLPPQAVPTV